MRTRVSPFLFFLFCACCYITVASAQNSQKNEPFTAGEILTYEGKLSKAIFRGISVADLSFAVTNSPDSKYYIITTEATSKGSLAKILNIKFRQVYQATVEKDRFRSLRTVKHDEQRDRIRDGEAVFDYPSKQVTYIETDPNDMMRPPRRIASGIKGDTFDLVSGIYNLRLLPLAVGKSFELSISDSGFVYSIPVRVTAREQVTSIYGKNWCFKVEPEVFGPRRIIEDNGKMVIWITDDTQRIPVRAQINTGIGKIEIKLKKIGK